jgi:hypothetical protein
MGNCCSDNGFFDKLENDREHDYDCLQTNYYYKPYSSNSFVNMKNLHYENLQSEEITKSDSGIII